ncbi:MAG: gamma-glutamyltransferase [Gammaproteobacteria bacterium]|nr:gamma-glutamyltransferase [Gammaproteobacteria bacterium]
MRGVIAAGHELTVQAAENALKDGGNAYDAVLAGLAAACVAEPVLASLGGGGYLLAQPASGPARLYDFFVQTPRRRRPPAELDFHPILADFGTARQEFHTGHGSAAAPGVVRGLFEVHRDLATLPMRALVAPAVEWAARGIRVEPFQAYVLRVVEAIYAASPAALAVYGSCTHPGALVDEGERLVQPELADVLDSLASEGAELFYRGEIARTIVRDMQDGGQLQAEDLAGYRVERREPLAVDYRSMRLLTNPPPATGGILLAFALRLLEALDPSGLEFGSAEHLGLLAEVMALTSEARARAHLDEGMVHPDAERFLHPGFVDAYRRRLAAHPRSRGGTTQLSVIDAHGNLASLSVSNGEGSGYVIPHTGIMMNNMLGESDLNPGGFHRWPAGARMTSMMAPTVARRRDGFALATGSGGSNRIRSAVLQVLVNMLDLEMGVEPAVLAPRIHLESDLLSIEGGFDRARLTLLLRRYPQHQLWEARNLFFGGAHTVAIGPRGWEAAGDPRRGGAAHVVTR